jgi:membrane-bound lytic murein transglycosylase D
MSSPLRIGSELNIGNKNIYRTINSKKRTILYSVKQGDSLYRIADIFNIEISDIKKINELSTNEIKPGQVLKLLSKRFNLKKFLDLERLLGHHQKNSMQTK